MRQLQGKGKQTLATPCPLLRAQARPRGEVLEVVGVVGTAKYRSLLEEPRLFFYRPFVQAYRPAMTLMLPSAARGLVTRPFPSASAQRNPVADLQRQVVIARRGQCVP